MKKSVISISVVGLAVGLFYFVAGLQKLFGDGFVGFGEGLSGMMGTSEMISLILSIIVILSEVIGGFFVLIYFIYKNILNFLGNKIVNILLFLSLLSFLAIDVIGFILTDWFNMQELSWHLMLAIVIIGIMLDPLDLKSDK